MLILLIPIAGVVGLILSGIGLACILAVTVSTLVSVACYGIFAHTQLGYSGRDLWLLVSLGLPIAALSSLAACGITAAIRRRRRA